MTLLELENESSSLKFTDFSRSVGSGGAFAGYELAYNSKYVSTVCEGYGVGDSIVSRYVIMRFSKEGRLISLTVSVEEITF